MILQLRDRGLDRVDMCGAGQGAALELRIDLLEVPSELRDAVVRDDEPEGAVDRIQR